MIGGSKQEKRKRKRKADEGSVDHEGGHVMNMNRCVATYECHDYGP